MASSKAVDVNVISRNGADGDNQLVALTIDQIVSVYKDGDNVTTIKYAPFNDNATSMTPVIYKVLETLGDIIVKANNADFDNGLILLTVTHFNYNELRTPSEQILNRVKIQVMTPVYASDGTVEGTLIKYGHWFKSIIQVEEDLVTNTSSS